MRIRKQFITTNMMGWFDGFDHYTVTQDLDLASWDDYVGRGHLDPGANGAAHDLTRGFKRKNFWVMETQPGSVNWAAVNNSLDKGEVRAMAWHDDRSRRGRGELLAMAQRVERAGAVSRDAGRARRHARFRCMRRCSRSARNSRKRALRWRGHRSSRRSRFCIRTTAAGRFNGRSTTRITIRWRKSSVITGHCAPSASPIDVIAADRLRWRSTSSWWRRD